MPKKRHYINEAESEQIFSGLILRLGQLLKTEEDQESAEVVLHLLSRLIESRSGRPKNLEFTWSQAKTAYEIYGGQTTETPIDEVS
jgi:hypothetical protein